jgi:hypothetical protein
MDFEGHVIDGVSDGVIFYTHKPHISHHHPNHQHLLLSSNNIPTKNKETWL